MTANDDDDNPINFNAADSDKPSKSRRKVAEMIDDINVALGLKKADAERLEKKRKKQEAKEKLKGKLLICMIPFLTESESRNQDEY